MGVLTRIANRLHTKLKAQTGESIAETMVAVLIAALALLMLAGAISSSLSVVKVTRKKLENYYHAANVFNRMPEVDPEVDSSKQKIPVKVKDENGNDVVLTYVVSDTVDLELKEDPTDGDIITFNNDSEKIKTIHVRYYENSEFRDKKVVIYKETPQP